MGGPLNGRTGDMMRWAISLALAGVVAYFTAQNAANQRLTVVETDIRWMRTTLDKLDGRLERVIDDWSTGVNRRTGEPLPLQQSIERER